MIAPNHEDAERIRKECEADGVIIIALSDNAICATSSGSGFEASMKTMAQARLAVVHLSDVGIVVPIAHRGGRA